MVSEKDKRIVREYIDYRFNKGCQIISDEEWDLLNDTGKLRDHETILTLANQAAEEAWNREDWNREGACEHAEQLIQSKLALADAVSFAKKSGLKFPPFVS